jgi:hypothetical protein
MNRQSRWQRGAYVGFFIDTRADALCGYTVAGVL